MLNIVFMGTPEFSVEILKGLRENFNVNLVLTAPDKPVGRKLRLTPSEVKNYLLSTKFSGDILEPKTLKDEEILKKISSYKPDFIVVAAYGKILPKSILDIAPCINLHASILPKYRGASPIQSAILNADVLSGVSAMMMQEGLDCGDMLGFSYLSLKDLRSDEAFLKLGVLARNLIIKVLKNFKNIRPLAQIDSLASNCAKISKSDGLIKFSDNALEVYNKFRAFYPWPGIYFENGIKLKDIKYHSNKVVKEGKISKITEDGICVGFSGGEIEIKLIQEVGKKVLSAKDYINGKRLKIGDNLF